MTVTDNGGESASCSGGAHGLWIWRCHVQAWLLLESRSRGGLGEERLLHRGARCSGSCGEDCGVQGGLLCGLWGGRLLCGRRAGVCDPRDPSPTEPGESGVRCTHAIPRTPANGIFYKRRGNPTHLVQRWPNQPTIKKGVSSKKLNSKLQTWRIKHLRTKHVRICLLSLEKILQFSILWRVKSINCRKSERSRNFGDRLFLGEPTQCTTLSTHDQGFGRIFEIICRSCLAFIQWLGYGTLTNVWMT